MDLGHHYDLIDIGANLTDPQFQGFYNGKQKHEPDIEDVLLRAKKHRIRKIIVTSGSLEDLKEAIEFCDRYDPDFTFLFTTIGVHPTRCSQFQENEDKILEELLKIGKQNAKRIVAIGEIGLDFDRLHFCPKDIQIRYISLSSMIDCLVVESIRYFKKQLQCLTKNFRLPLFLHLRNAQTEFIDCLKEVECSLQGVVHSFTGSKAELEELLNAGFDIGVNGCSLKSLENLDVAASIPMERMHIESDAPWCDIRQTHSSWNHLKTAYPMVNKPEKWQRHTLVKGRNEPCKIIQVAEILASLKKLPDCNTLLKIIPVAYFQIFSHNASSCCLPLDDFFTKQHRYIPKYDHIVITN